jgi:hypothetical protein
VQEVETEHAHEQEYEEAAGARSEKSVIQANEPGAAGGENAPVSTVVTRTMLATQVLVQQV